MPTNPRQNDMPGAALLAAWHAKRAQLRDDIVKAVARRYPWFTEEALEHAVNLGYQIVRSGDLIASKQPETLGDCEPPRLE